MTPHRLRSAVLAATAAAAAASAAAPTAPSAWQPVDPLTIQPTEPGYEAAWQAKLSLVLGAHSPWEVPGGLGGAMCVNGTDPDQGKYVWPALLAEMWKVRENLTALTDFATRSTTSVTSLGAAGYFTSQVCGTFYKPFNSPGIMTYLAEFGVPRRGRPAIVPATSMAAFATMLTQQGWAQARRLEGTLDPIYNYGEFDSENFYAMSRASALLAAEMLGNPYELAAGQAWLSNTVRAFFNKGRLEWDSTVYMAYVLQPMLMLFEYSANATVRAQARAVADWVIAAHSAKMLDGWQVGPDARGKPEGMWPFFGSSWAMSYMLAAVPAGAGVPGGPTFHPTYTDAAAAAAWEVDWCGQLPWTSYRPHQALVNLARRNVSLPYTATSAKPFYRLNAGGYAHWAAGDADPNGRRFEFETVHAEGAFLLASLAAGRPNGGYVFPVGGLYGPTQLPFSEQHTWRLGVVGGEGGVAPAAPGAALVFGNAGPGFTTPSGRSPWEQLGQAGPALLRVLSGTDVAWVALPNTTQVTWAPLAGAPPGAPPGAFADMGHGVFLALLPFGAVGNATAAPYATNPAWATLTWPFSNGTLGALALEVGSQGAFGSFPAFVAAVAGTPRFHLLEDRTPQLLAQGGSSGGGGTLAYLSAGGTNLTVAHSGVGTYAMVDGNVVSPAGQQPSVFIDGELVDFASFDSFGADPRSANPPPLAQAWGSGALEVTTAGAALRITVDPATGAVAYYEQ